MACVRSCETSVYAHHHPFSVAYAGANCSCVEFATRFECSLFQMNSLVDVNDGERTVISYVLSAAQGLSEVRPPDWQGSLARSGLRLAPDVRPTQSSSRTLPTYVDATPGSYWSVIEQSAGGGERGLAFARQLQRHLMCYVDALPLDEIELLAGGRAQGHS